MTSFDPDTGNSPQARSRQLEGCTLRVSRDVDDLAVKGTFLESHLTDPGLILYRSTRPSHILVELSEIAKRLGPTCRPHHPSVPSGTSRISRPRQFSTFVTGSNITTSSKISAKTVVIVEREHRCAKFQKAGNPLILGSNKRCEPGHRCQQSKTRCCLSLFWLPS
ncbi:hypothetical protein PDIG_05740 [Penicillium digitatum PHI26]|uniref:Uncharacterized protein n=2 Tax=Penicillium digitatum TaxID=36651 RepID=K9GD18_PEND2|nr:hypothetical protein PDIP_10420 [Penicillium digitatum Pd1]EKV19077.1 hypothetical protein PDIG_05740 [Penicillium digitatum PHI26]EKV20986.1 hypothetical protein PDIP_10420 [Penicillium digitatum Pd1]